MCTDRGSFFLWKMELQIGLVIYDLWGTLTSLNILACFLKSSSLAHVWKNSVQQLANRLLSERQLWGGESPPGAEEGSPNWVQNGEVTSTYFWPKLVLCISLVGLGMLQKLFSISRSWFVCYAFSHPWSRHFLDHDGWRIQCNQVRTNYSFLLSNFFESLYMYFTGNVAQNTFGSAFFGTKIVQKT